MGQAGRGAAAGADEYGTAFRDLSGSRENKPVRYEVLKRCSLMTAISKTAFAVAADGLDYSFEELRRVLAAHPAEAGWFQLNGMVRKGAWAAWWLDGQEKSFTAAGLPSAMTETAARLAAQLTRVDGDTAVVERLRLLVLAGRHREAVDEFDRWYPQFENVADFTVCRKLAEAVAPDDLRRFAADALDAELLRRRERAERRLELSAGLHEYFERTRHYVSRCDIEGILESAIHGTVPSPPGVLPEGIPPGPPRVIHLHAGGGMGKSTQLAWLVARFGVQQHPPLLSAVLDAQSMVSERVRDVPELLLVNAAERVLEQAQVLDREHRTSGMEHFLRAHGHRRRELDREFAPPGYAPMQHWNATPLPQDVVAVFADALNEIAGRHPVLLCLDTTDELLQAEEGELSRLFGMLGRLVWQVPWLRLVLSGRSDVTSRDDFRDAFRDVPWRALELKPFTGQEARRYLRLRGVAPEQAARIVAVCEQDVEGSPAFNPLILALLADSPDKLPTASDSLYLFVVDRELDYIKDDYTRTALKYCAVARHPTYEYFLKVLFPLLPAHGGDATDTEQDEPADPEGLWRRLVHYARRSAWISAQDTRLNVHVNVRRELLRTMRSTEERVWRQLHRDAAVRCEDLARLAGSTQEQAGWVAEQVYHQLHSAVDRPDDHDAFLEEVAQTWHEQVASAWRRGDFATVIDLADRLLSADLERPDSDADGLGWPDPQVMSFQLWYDIALERAYGELHAVLYGGRAGWFDVERYLRLAERRSRMSCPGHSAVRQDRLRVEVITAALSMRRGLRDGLAPVHDAHDRLRRVLEERRTSEAGTPRGLADLWTADAQLLLASCQVRIGRTQERPHLSHAGADRDLTTMFEAAVAREAFQAPLVARYAMQDWDLADRPDLVRAWHGRLERLNAPIENWLQLLAADAELRSGLPLAAERFPRSGLTPDDLRADLVLARSQMLMGDAEDAGRLLREVTLPAVAGQVEPDLAFETLMVLARACVQVLELSQAETYAGMAMGRASDDERRLSVMVLRATTALSVAGDLGRADQWISRSKPLREGPRGPAGTAMNGAECALLHRWGRFEEAEDLVRRWAAQLRERRAAAGRRGDPPTPAEWLCYGLHALVCGPVGEVKNHLATVTTAGESIPTMNRRLMLLAEQARLYATIAEKGLLTDPARVDAIERLLGRHDSGVKEADRPAGLRALWSAELHTLLLGRSGRAATDLRKAADLLGPDNRQLHSTWLRLHPLMPEDLLPAPLPEAQDIDTTQNLTLRAADLMARAHHKSRRQRRKTAADAAAILRLTTETDVPTAWHLNAARHGADVGIPADTLADLLHTPMIEEARRRNLQFALRRLGRYDDALPTGKADERWYKAWAAYRREVRGEVPDHLRQAVLAAAEERPVTQVEVDVHGNAPGAARPVLEPPAATQENPRRGPVVWRVTEDFLLSSEPLGVADEQPVDVILLHGDMRPYDQGAALRLPGSARSIRPEDVDAAVRKLCDRRRQAPPLVVLDALPQEAADGDAAELRDLFAFQLHLLGYVPAVLTSGPLHSDPDGSWRRTALRQAVAFGRTAHQIAERLQQMAARREKTGARIRLLTHIPEEESFGIGLL